MGNFLDFSPRVLQALRTLGSQPNPSPNAPRDQIRHKEPLLRLWLDFIKHWAALFPNKLEGMQLESFPRTKAS